MTNRVSTAEDDWDQVRAESTRVLLGFLRSPTTDKEAVLAVKYATVGLSNVTRHEQTQGAQAATTFAMARELAENSQQLAEYLRIAMPSAPVVKALPPGGTPEGKA